MQQIKCYNLSRRILLGFIIYCICVVLALVEFIELELPEINMDDGNAIAFFASSGIAILMLLLKPLNVIISDVPIVISRFPGFLGGIPSSSGDSIIFIDISTFTGRCVSFEIHMISEILVLFSRLLRLR